MQLVHVNDFVGKRKTDRPAVLHLDVFHVGGKLVDGTRYRELVQRAKRSADVNGSSHGGVSSEASLKISADDGVNIEALELQGQLRRKIVPQVDCAVEQE